MGAKRRTSLSAGILVREVLFGSMTDKVTKIYPILAQKAELPYITYSRVEMGQINNKQRPFCDEAKILVSIYGKTYDQSLELAEEVRELLDGVTYGNEEMNMRSCYLSDASDDYEADAFVNHLTFNIKI